METKRCFTCKISKAVTEFWPATTGKYNSNCKPCANQRRNAWYKSASGKHHIAKMNLAPLRKFARLRYDARKRGVAVELTKDQFLSIVRENCHYCGYPLEDYGHGLDRMDNAKGYSLDNVVPCCNRCNRVKAEYFTYDEMIEVGRTITTIRSRRSS